MLYPLDPVRMERRSVADWAAEDDAEFSGYGKACFFESAAHPGYACRIEFIWTCGSGRFHNNI